MISCVTHPATKMGPQRGDTLTRHSRRARLVAAGAAAVLLAAGAAIIAPVQAQSGAGLPTRTVAPSQGIIASGLGCGNSITLTGLTESAGTVGVKTLVRPAAGQQLIPYDVDGKPVRLLYSAYDCNAKTFRLYLQDLSSRPVPQLLLATTPDQWLVGAAWDPMADTPIAVIRDSNYTYTAILLNAGTWTSVWRATKQQLGLSLTGIEGQTGGEFIVYGDDLAGRWATIRASRISGSSGIELTGSGALNHITSTGLGEATAYLTSTGAYVCDGLTSGSIDTAIGRGACTQTGNQSTSNGVFVSSSPQGNAYWLNVQPVLSSNLRIPVSCPAGSLFSCGNPSAGPATPAGAWPGQDMVWTALYDVRFTTLGPAGL